MVLGRLSGVLASEEAVQDAPILAFSNRMANASDGSTTSSKREKSATSKLQTSATATNTKASTMQASLGSHAKGAAEVLVDSKVVEMNLTATLASMTVNRPRDQIEVKTSGKTERLATIVKSSTRTNQTGARARTPSKQRRSQLVGEVSAAVPTDATRTTGVPPRATLTRSSDRSRATAA